MQPIFKNVIRFSYIQVKRQVYHKKYFLKFKAYPCMLSNGINNLITYECSAHQLSTQPSLALENIKRFYSTVKIYTKTGDQGKTSLYTGERRLKCDAVFNVLGNIDELSSFIGLAKETALEKNHDYVEQLERIQCILQDVATLIATPIQLKNINDEERKVKIEKRIRFSERHILELEGWIDQHTKTLPPLTNFILPGGGRISASLHVCRTVCRRAERSIVPLINEEVVDQNVLSYLNRLSDYLFTVARYATIVDGKKETIYIRPKPNKSLEKNEIKEVKMVNEKG